MLDPRYKHKLDGVDGNSPAMPAAEQTRAETYIVDLGKRLFGDQGGVRVQVGCLNIGMP